MRADILAYLKTLSITGFKVSSELPWDSNGTPLYLKNFKTLYVDQAQVAQEPLIDVLNGAGIVNEITTVSVYVATDAKTAPSNLDTMISQVRAARLDTSITGVTQRATQVSTELTSDTQVTTFEFSFKQLIVNS